MTCSPTENLCSSLQLSAQCLICLSHWLGFSFTTLVSKVNWMRSEEVACGQSETPDNGPPNQLPVEKKLKLGAGVQEMIGSYQQFYCS